jgi:hypothetical protein
MLRIIHAVVGAKLMPRKIDASSSLRRGGSSASNNIARTAGIISEIPTYRVRYA